eukprot:Amastigsp_a8600_9.p4 type:complete len:146 gc:universal Amastigsp_a8600_9:956-1393(+)
MLRSSSSWTDAWSVSIGHCRDRSAWSQSFFRFRTNSMTRRARTPAIASARTEVPEDRTASAGVDSTLRTTQSSRPKAQVLKAPRPPTHLLPAPRLCPVLRSTTSPALSTGSVPSQRSSRRLSICSRSSSGSSWQTIPRSRARSRC